MKHVFSTPCYWAILLGPAAAMVFAAAPATVIAGRSFGISAPLGSLGADVQLEDFRAPDGPLSWAQPPAAFGSLTVSASIQPFLNFGAIAGGSYIYPDANGAAGSTQYMQWTNARYAVYSKASGALLAGPVDVKKLWLGSNTGNCTNLDSGDGIINYDKAAGRWVVTHHAGNGPPFVQCVAVSVTSDATGSYYLYAFALTSTEFPDYPQLAVWPDAYYVTANLLDPKTFRNVTGQVCALDRASMLNGRPASAQCFTTTTRTKFSVLQPGDLDGSAAPPAGAPNYLLALDFNSLDLYRFHVDWANPANSTLTGPVNIPVAPFTQACNGGYCIPQGGSTRLLDGVGDRLVHRLAYRNFGDHEALVMSHAVIAGASVGVRWYEFRNPAGTPQVFQQATFAPDANYRWLPSSAMDHSGNFAVGYSVSSTTMFPSIRFTGRLATDPFNTLQGEATIFNGTGAQTHAGNDWGNASSLSVDPSDDCTFWYTNETIPNTGTHWATRIASFKFSTCR